MSTKRKLAEVSADQLVDRIVRRVISGLQRLKNCRLSGDDSGLENTWDEICVQVQEEESIYWDAYDETVRMFVDAELRKLTPAAMQVVWLQTEAGWDWSDDDSSDEESQREIPACRDDVIPYIVKKIYDCAADWSNRRIRDYLERTLD